MKLNEKRENFAEKTNVEENIISEEETPEKDNQL